MENNVVVFDYQGSNIPFELTGNDVMINATEMAKPFGPNKRPYQWLRSKDAREYINALLTARNLRSEDLVITYEGGSNYVEVRGGTWMHRLVAIRYAQWLNPYFAVWVDMKIDEIINQGYAFRDAEIQKLTEENNKLQGQLQIQEPKVNYYNNILQQNRNLYTTRDLCQELGLRISNKKFLREMINRGIGYRDSKNKFYLRSPWCNMGYRATVTEKCNDGNYRSVTRWTESGKYWIWSLAIDWKLI